MLWFTRFRALSDAAVVPLDRTLRSSIVSEFRYASAIMLLNELPRHMKWIIIRPC